MDTLEIRREAIFQMCLQLFKTFNPSSHSIFITNMAHHTAVYHHSKRTKHKRHIRGKFGNAFVRYIRVLQISMSDGHLFSLI